MPNLEEESVMGLLFHSCLRLGNILIIRSTLMQAIAYSHKTDLSQAYAFRMKYHAGSLYSTAIRREISDV